MGLELRFCLWVLRAAEAVTLRPPIPAHLIPFVLEPPPQSIEPAALPSQILSVLKGPKDNFTETMGQLLILAGFPLFSNPGQADMANHRPPLRFFPCTVYLPA